MCVGIYEGRVSVRGVKRTCESLERVVPVEGSKKRLRLLRQRSCFRVERGALRGALPQFDDQCMGGTIHPDVVFGQIVHFVRAGGTVETPLLLARVLLFRGLNEASLVRELATDGVPLWRHDYGVVHMAQHVSHLMPASVIGDMVSIIPHPDEQVARRGYCLVLQKD